MPAKERPAAVKQLLKKGKPRRAKKAEPPVRKAKEIAQGIVTRLQAETVPVGRIDVHGWPAKKNGAWRKCSRPTRGGQPGSLVHLLLEVICARHCALPALDRQGRTWCYSELMAHTMC